MSSGKPEKAKHKAKRKKLTLSKETLKDLTVAQEGAALRGGAGVVSRKVNTVVYACGGTD
jgi:hypothetical protein